MGVPVSEIEIYAKHAVSGGLNFTRYDQTLNRRGRCPAIFSYSTSNFEAGEHLDVRKIEVERASEFRCGMARVDRDWISLAGAEMRAKFSTVLLLFMRRVGSCFVSSDWVRRETNGRLREFIQQTQRMRQSHRVSEMDLKLWGRTMLIQTACDLKTTACIE